MWDIEPELPAPRNPAAPASGSDRLRRCRRGGWAAILLAGFVVDVCANERPPASSVNGVKPAAVAVGSSRSAPSSHLKWDALSKSRVPKPEEMEIEYEFTATNLSGANISFLGFHTTCGCTVAQMPPLPDRPFVLAAGASATLRVKLDVHGKVGAIAKTVNVETSIGPVQLAVHADIPHGGAASGSHGAMGVARIRNLEIAARDRQAVFQGDCAKCHSTPAAGKMGEDLYLAVCTLCHDASPRAAMIPDLNIPRSPRDLAFWQKWIADGAPGTMMPAFGAAHGGPLSPDQVTSLARYLHDAFPRAPLALPAEPSAGASPRPNPP